MTDPSEPTPPDLPRRGGDAEAEALLAAGLSSPASGGRASPPPPAEVQVRFPDYEILEVLGQGGMGVVYKARHRRLDRLVALKVLPEALSGDPAFAERFAREARTLARLQHAHIVGVHDFGVAGSQHYLVMEYVDGVNLRQLMASGELSPREALAIVPQICDALQYAHDEGVVHRDIKPENVLLDRGGSVKVADFGLAKLVGHAPGEMTLTGTDQVMGTLHYMAPEQYRTPQSVDHRADIFSLGVVFYEMLTGELPVGRFEKPSEAKDLDERIDRIVLRALEREREQRYQKAREVRTDVDTLLRDGPEAPAEARAPRTVAESVRHHARAWRARRDGEGRRMSRWALWALLAVPIAAVLAVVAYAFVDATGDPRHGQLYRGIVGWWVALCGCLGAVLASVTAIVVTRHGRQAVRGQGTAVLALLLAIGGVLGSLAGLADEVRWHTLRVRSQALGYARDPMPMPMPSNPRIPVTGAWNEKDEGQIAAEVTDLFDAWKRVATRAQPDLGALRTMGLYAREDVERLEQMSEDERAEASRLLALGMGFVRDDQVSGSLASYRVQRVDVSAESGTGRVRAVASPAPGTLVAGSITFPVKWTGEGWVFEIGPVVVR